MTVLQTEVRTIGQKQDLMSVAVEDVQKSVSEIGLQLSVMTEVLKSLRPDPPGRNREKTTDIGTSAPVKSPTLLEQENRNALLRAQLEKEKEQTRSCEEVFMQRLPPINVTKPPGFHNQRDQDQVTEGPTPPAGTSRPVHTPVFNQHINNRESQLWQGYYRTYEQEMKAQFIKSMTKGPRMDFPKFDGTDPVGWIRQSNKFFQMAGAPEEYKVSLAQLHIVGEADVWLRRSGLLKQKLTWNEFGEQIVHRFSASGSYDLTEKFNNVKQHGQTVQEYTKIFEDLMADVQYENPTLSETWFVRCYVNGLRGGIKYQLRPPRPSSVTEAYWMARDVEPSHPPKKTSSVPNTTSA
ncbi:uncharacterized protein [Aegilops tauschii subsp. strangulata]|uniref:uncharacterized protein n=1 Tax=Aegilops tauschii subsp. strangulata TaxID=200361 RepID=UPI003CC89A81